MKKKAYIVLILTLLLIFAFYSYLFAQWMAFPYFQCYEYDPNLWYLDPNGLIDALGVDTSSRLTWKKKDGTYKKFIDSSGNIALSEPVYITDGTGNDLIIDISSNDIKFQNTNKDKDIYIDCNLNGTMTNAVFIDGNSAKVTFPKGIIETNGVLKQNLLSNTEGIYCSNSDSAKGIGAMTFDAGQTAAPTAGLAVTGGTSSATGKLMTVTVATGDWSTNDAVGTMTLGSCSGRFHDNEPITWTGGQATINKPNSAPGVDKIQNGELSVDTDPPPGWISGNSATLTTEAGGKIGNCIMVTENGAQNPYAYQTSIVVGPGKVYYLLGYVKAGTEATYQITIYDVTNSANIWISGSLEETAGDWSTSFSRYFVAPTNCINVRINLQQICAASAATTIYFDEISLYEITRGCTATDNLDFDTWYKDTTLDIYAQFNDGGTLTHDGCFSSLKCVPSAADDFRYFPNATRRVLPEWTQQFAGKVVTAEIGCLTSTANHAFIQIIDSDTTDYNQTSDSSSYHTGGGTWEWLSVTSTISASTSEFSVAIVFDQSSGITYFTMPILTYGYGVGAWNYIPESDKIVYFENDIASQSFNAKTGANGFSDVSTATTIQIEADSLGCIGKGVKAVRVFASVNDSGSAGTDCYYQAGQALSTIGSEFMLGPAGLANDLKRRDVNWIPLNASNQYQYTIDATGSNTFDINLFKYIGGESR